MTETETIEKTSIILTIDIGSSSIRCTPFVYSTHEDHHSTRSDHSAAAAATADALAQPPLPIHSCSSACQRSSVDPETGRIVLERLRDPSSTTTTSATTTTTTTTSTKTCSYSLWQEIDSCIDDTLQCLRTVPWTPFPHQEQTNIHNHVEKSPRHFEIVAVGITTFVMNLVGILSPSASTCSSFNDRDKMMLSHHNMSLVIDSKYTCSYACNTNSAQVKCRELHQLLGETRAWNLYQRTGAPIHVAYALGQLGDLYGTVNKNNNEKIVKWTSIASICISNWTGRDILSMPISYSEASWTGMFDFRSGTWDEECLSLLPVSCRDALPDVGEEVLEGLSDVYQKRWPEFRKDCKFVLGCGDGACANIGSKCTSVDRIAVTIGTSAAARLLLRLPLVFKDNKGCSSNNGVCNTVSNSDASLDEIPMGLFCYRIDQNHVLLGGALTDGGSVIAWLRKLLNLNSENEYEECQQKAFIQYMTKSAIGAAVTATATDSHENDAAVNSSKVLTFLPFLSGERSTGFRVGATGCISGILRSTTSVDLLQECLESVVLRIHAILELFQKAVMFDDVCSPTTIVASGNALEKNELWRKMLADCSNMTVVLDENTHEGTSRGAAIMVANALVDSYITEIPKEKLFISHQSIPDQSYRRYWHVKKEIQNKLIDTIESTWK